MNAEATTLPDAAADASVSSHVVNRDTVEQVKVEYLDGVDDIVSNAPGRVKVEYLATESQEEEPNKNWQESNKISQDPQRQVRLDGLNKFCTQKDLKALLKKLDIDGVHRLKKVPNQAYCFIYFQTPEARFAAEKMLDGYKWKGRALSVLQATPLDPDRFIKRHREAEERSGLPDAKRAAMDTGCSREHAAAIERTVADVVAPLHRLPYAEQLEKKQSAMYKILRTLPIEMQRAARASPADQRPAWAFEWLSAERLREARGLPCPVEPVVPSPLERGYRNKCEFHCGLDAAGNACVGFTLGQAKLGVHVLGDVSEVPSVSPHMIAAAARVQSFVASSRFPVFDKVSNVGFWRLLTARQAFHCGEPPQMLLMVSVQVGEAEATEVEAEFERLAAHLQATPLQPPALLSLVALQSDGPGETANSGDIKLVFGDAYLQERILDMTFRISPFAFFQVNSGGAECLCSLLRSHCGITESTVLLDVCCGTGTLSLSMASAVRRVIGVELNEAAVQDAKVNAELNGITNATFIAQKAETATRNVLDGLSPLEKANLVAIVDPPRAGLHPDVLKALRACSPLRRILYVSCHAPSFVQNAVALCRPTSLKFRGEPFSPKRAFPVDLFPHTDKCEVVVLLERSITTTDCATGVSSAESATVINEPAGTVPTGRSAELLQRACNASQGAKPDHHSDVSEPILKTEAGELKATE
eukprot:CAMPEP_0119303014 /NCGR_PEP_ID=MMETSP1333-20130426/4512_1 /TAXON_ID=418940 /ORGANISM="Scyphosphaera apsteinii, Strain RCC1455" /LENGTH=701 /DNA_ID=CAMNT_0007305561 /DNA_START=12 /DNA_END=2117 /DNA_ORIENTATION=-